MARTWLHMYSPCGCKFKLWVETTEKHEGVILLGVQVIQHCGHERDLKETDYEKLLHKWINDLGDQSEEDNSWDNPYPVLPKESGE